MYTYTRHKITLKNRITIPVGAIAELEVNEVMEIPSTSFKNITQNYGMFYLRKYFTMKGVFQAVHSPFPEGFKAKPTIVVENRHITDIELLAKEEIGEFWIFSNYE